MLRPKRLLPCFFEQAQQPWPVASGEVDECGSNTLPLGLRAVIGNSYHVTSAGNLHGYHLGRMCGATKHGLKSIRFDKILFRGDAGHGAYKAVGLKFSDLARV
jgi:hypothetical protein